MLNPVGWRRHVWAWGIESGVAAPSKYIFLRPIRKEMWPKSGMDMNDTTEAHSTATSRKIDKPRPKSASVESVKTTTR
jgi:hypothetical protein